MGSRRAWRGVGLLIAAGAALVGCDSSTGGDTAVDFGHPVGIATSPEHPLLPDRLPKGWELVQASLGAEHWRGGMHALYLGPGATLTNGPAIVIGASGREGGVPVCGHPGQGPARWRNWNFVPGPDLNEMITDTSAWALGRDVDVRALRRAVNSAAWAGQDGSEPRPRGEQPPHSSVPASALPPGFRLAATSYAGPGENFHVFETLAFRSHNRAQYLYVATGNTAFLALARFWQDALEPSCPNGFDARTWVIGDAVVTALRDPPDRETEAVVDALRPVPRSTWERRTAGLAEEDDDQGDYQSDFSGHPISPSTSQP